MRSTRSLDKKYPGAAWEGPGGGLFPATRLHRDQRSGHWRGHHLHEAGYDIPHHPGAAGPQRHCDHDDLHSRHEPRWKRGEESPLDGLP